MVMLRRAALVLCLILIPSFAWWNASYQYKRNITGVTSALFLPANLTASDIDGNSVSERIYGVPEWIYYNDDTDAKNANDTTELCYLDTWRERFECPNKPTGLMIHWSFDDNTSLTDYFGGHNESAGAPNSRTATGKFYNAYDFESDGADDYILIPDHADFDGLGDEGTVSFWIKVEGGYDTASGARLVIFNKDNAGANAGDIFIAMETEVAGAEYDGTLRIDLGQNEMGLRTTKNDWEEQWYHIVIRWKDTDTASGDAEVWVDGVNDRSFNFTVATTPWNNADAIYIGSSYSGSLWFDGMLDEIQFYDYHVTDAEIAQLWGARNVELGAEIESGDITFSKNILYPFENELITFTANWTSGNFTKFWWNFSDGGSIGYTTNQEYNHTYTAAGSYTVNLTAYNSDTLSNSTTTKTITVYAELSAVNISITDHLPFLGAASSQNFSFTTTGGTPILNNSWTITLPNTSIFYYVNESPLTFTPEIEGEHTVALTVCDLNGGACVSDTDGYKPWNITGGVFLVTSFNQTGSLLSEVLVGDTITFSSADSVSWEFGSTSLVGTSAELTFSASDAFYSNKDYYQFNVTVNNTWGAYTSNTWFSVIAARYYINATTSCTDNNYCFVYGEVYNEVTETEIAGNKDYIVYFLSSGAYGHELETGRQITAADLNLSLCINATPIITSLTLDGTITYEAAGYSSRTYAFDAAAISFVGSCSYTNGQKLKLYTLANTTSVADITFTITKGGIALDDALVTIQHYSNNTQTWFAVASQLTDTNGQVKIPLKQCNTYYKVLVAQGGETLYQEKMCFKSSAITIEIAGTPSEFYTILQSVSTSCSWDNSTEYMSCTISDSSGLTTLVTLDVYSTVSSTALCTSSEASTSTTLLCDMSSYGAGDFTYTLTITTPGGTTEVTNGAFSSGASGILTSDGMLIGVLLLAVVVLGTKLHPVISILLTTFVMFGLRVMNIISVGYGVMMWISALAIIALFKVVT